MDWLQIEDYMIVVEKDKTIQQYRNIALELNEHYDLFNRHCLEDTSFVQFLQQFGVEQTKPVFLQALAVDQGTAIMFTGKFYFEGYLEFVYKCTEFYHGEDEGGIMWNDPEIGIEWPIDDLDDIILSEKDEGWKSLKETGISW